MQQHPKPPFALGLLLTSDEEGPSTEGVTKVAEVFRARALPLRWCLVGEPSSEQRLGDVLKIGRRGTMTGFLTVLGQQGHVAYPQKADNPIHRSADFISALCRETWDQGNEHFPPTSLQISNIHAGTGAANVIPGALELVFNFRYGPESTAEHLQQRVMKLLETHELRYQLRWHLSGLPFLTQQGDLLNACENAIAQLLGLQPQKATHGGTSDGRFIAPLGVEVVELGPTNTTIHRIDEHIDLHELEQLTDLYTEILGQMLRSVTVTGAR